ncbi:MAG: twin-arginine translocation signal domain-containing protein [Phycisphaerales bacterium]
MNRRTFIKGITGAAAAVAAGVFSGRKAKAEPVSTLLDTRPDNWITPEKLSVPPISRDNTLIVTELEKKLAGYMYEQEYGFPPPTRVEDGVEHVFMQGYWMRPYQMLPT